VPTLSAVVPSDLEGGLRLDRFVAERLGVLTRSQIKTRGLEARVNGKTVKISRLLVGGDRLEIEWNDPEPSELIPQDIPLAALYEDDRVIVVDKPQGLVVHPGAGNREGTLANALLFRRLQRGSAGGGGNAGGTEAGFRPGIVHRLDKDTSGVIIAAYDDGALAFLADQFKARTTRKTYVAVVSGSPPAERGTISTLIARDPRDRKRFAVSAAGGKPALTHYRVAERFPGYALVLLRPKTGRTHQLRVHLRHLGCPILGDPIYGRPDRRFPKATLMLHAYRLKIRLPGSTEPTAFTAPLPDRFRRILRALRSATP
jgi:23S rRNA pseudouridine1911/1915/1917 synthase